jgi:hypothetical protein
VVERDALAVQKHWPPEQTGLHRAPVTPAAMRSVSSLLHWQPWQALGKVRDAVALMLALPSTLEPLNVTVPSRLGVTSPPTVAAEQRANACGKRDRASRHARHRPFAVCNRASAGAGGARRLEHHGRVDGRLDLVAWRARQSGVLAIRTGGPPAPRTPGADAACTSAGIASGSTATAHLRRTGPCARSSVIAAARREADQACRCNEPVSDRRKAHRTPAFIGSTVQRRRNLSATEPSTARNLGAATRLPTSDTSGGNVVSASGQVEP